MKLFSLRPLLLFLVWLFVSPYLSQAQTSIESVDITGGRAGITFIDGKVTLVNKAISLKKGDVLSPGDRLETGENAKVELYIDRGKDLIAENKKIFDQLINNKDEIESSFGDSLLWRRLDEANASIIGKTYEFAGLKDADKWDMLQDTMIDGMIRFEKAIKKYIRELKL